MGVKYNELNFNQMIPLFYAKAKEGQLEFENKNSLFKYLVGLEGKSLVVEIYQEKNVRSLDQNALYWAYLRIISQETGNTQNDLHELFRRTLLPPQFKKILGRTIKLPASTTTLSKAEMGEYLDRIAAEVNIPIPNTEEYNNLI